MLTFVLKFNFFKRLTILKLILDIFGIFSFLKSDQQEGTGCVVSSLLGITVRWLKKGYSLFNNYAILE